MHDDETLLILTATETDELRAILELARSSVTLHRTLKYGPGDPGIAEASVAIDNLLRRLVPRSTPAPTTDTSVAFPVGDGSEIRLPVTRIAGGFARGPGGLCAFCAGDACGEDSAPDSPIARFFAANPIAPSCPVCDGRPS